MPYLFIFGWAFVLAGSAVASDTPWFRISATVTAIALTVTGIIAHQREKAREDARANHAS